LSGNQKIFGLSELVAGGISFQKILIFCLCLFSGSHLLFGQTIRDFKEIWVNESREYLLNNQKPLPYLQSGFHYFSHQQDNAFTEMLEQNDCRHPSEIRHAGDSIINPNFAFNSHRSLARHQIFPSQEEFYTLDVALHICLGNCLCPLFRNFHSSLTLQSSQNTFCL